jgi:1-acyl-sn-glycerol-3-phosphate acyltransferase
MKILRIVISIPLTIFFYIAFASTLVIFHIVQLFCYYLVSKSAHKMSVDWLNYFMMRTPYFLGTKIKVVGLEKLPDLRSVIIISNHQSMMDIPPIIWLLRKHHVKFIAKKELTNLIPSISFNLKKGGSLLIDRKKGKKSVQQIREYAKTLVERGHSVCIFPEGTRSKFGKIKEFKAGGVQALVEGSNGIPIVPFVVHGNHKIFNKGMFPLQMGQTVMYEILDPVDPNSMKPEEVAEFIQSKIEIALESRELN